MTKIKEAEPKIRFCDTCKEPFHRRTTEKVKDYEARGTCGKPECIRTYQRKAALLRLGLIRKENGETKPVWIWDNETYPKTMREFPKVAAFEDDPRAIADLGTPRYMMPEKGFGPLTASSAHTATEGRGMAISKRNGLSTR